MSDDQKEQIVESTEVDPKVDLLNKVQTYNDKYNSPEDSSASNPSQEKIIQIVVGEEGIPSIQYNGNAMSVAEVVGMLDMSKEILLKKTIGNTLLQQNLYNMMQGLSP